MLIFLSCKAAALTGSLSGTVSSLSGAPCSYATVFAFSRLGDFATSQTAANLLGEYTLTLNVPGHDSVQVCVGACSGVSDSLGYQLFDSTYTVCDVQPIWLHDGVTVPGIDFDLGAGGDLAGLMPAQSGTYTGIYTPIAEVSGQWGELWVDPERVALYQPVSLYLPMDYNPFNSSFVISKLNSGASYDLGAAIINDVSSAGFPSISIRDYLLNVTPGTAGITLVSPSVFGAIHGHLYLEDPGLTWQQDNLGVALQRGLHEIALAAGLTVDGEFLIPSLVPDEYQLRVAGYVGDTYWWGEDYLLHVAAGDTLEVAIQMVPLAPGIIPDAPLSQAYQMVSAYPNPFNSAITFQISLPAAAMPAELAIFDLQGREIVRQKWPGLSGGQQRFTWQPANESAGLYFYRLSTPSNTIFGKCLYLK